MLDTFGMRKAERMSALGSSVRGRLWRDNFLRDRPHTGAARVVQRSRFNFFSEAQIWYSRDPEQNPVSEFENVIVLSDEFYREIPAHPIPTA